MAGVSLNGLSVGTFDSLAVTSETVTSLQLTGAFSGSISSSNVVGLAPSATVDTTCAANVLSGVFLDARHGPNVALTNAATTTFPNVLVANTLWVTGNAYVAGNTFTIKSTEFLSNALVITNAGSGPAASITQTGAGQAVLSVVDNGFTSIYAAQQQLVLGGATQQGSNLISMWGSVGVSNGLSVQGNIACSGYVTGNGAYLSSLPAATLAAFGTGAGFLSSYSNNVTLSVSADGRISAWTSAAQTGTTLPAILADTGNVGLYGGNLVLGGGSTYANSRLVVLGDVAFSGNLYQGSSLYSACQQFRNRIQNGNFSVNQRGIVSGAAGTTGTTLTINQTTYGLDRWSVWSSGVTALVLAVLQLVLTSTDAPNVNAGHIYSMRLTASTASSSNTYMVPQHCIEGLNVGDLAWGTSGAQPVTVSFWLRTSVASAVVSVALGNGAGNYSFVTTVTASSTSGAWGFYTITVPGCTSGTWQATTGAGIWLRIGSTGSSNTTSTLGAWQSGSEFSASTATQWTATTGAYLEITGVQLERGTVASPFDLRPFSIELSLCQRYYYMVGNVYGCFIAICASLTGTTAYGMLYCPVNMRMAPTLGYSGTLNMTVGTFTSMTTNSNGGTNSEQQNLSFYVTGTGFYGSGATALGLGTGGSVFLTADF